MNSREVCAKTAIFCQGDIAVFRLQFGLRAWPRLAKLPEMRKNIDFSWHGSPVAGILDDFGKAILAAIGPVALYFTAFSVFEH